jgi:hypothetical protein
MGLKKGYAISIIVLMAFTAKAQPLDSLVVFSGYILDADSIPIQNALLVNYRTVRGYSTNEKGFFKIWVIKGDSLMINHLSYERRIIKANNEPSKSNCYYLKFAPYQMKTIAVNYRNIEMENFHRNMKLINEQMRKNIPSYRNNTEQNAYGPPPKAQFYGVNFSELFRYFKTERYRRNLKE